MIVCAHKNRKKHGRDRTGNQRYRCRLCGKTLTEPRVRPIGSMRIPQPTAELIIRLLMEGNSIRSCHRVTGVAENTISALLLEVGERCQSFLVATIRDIPASDVQADEVWSFCGMKERTRQRKRASEEYGDSYCYTAIDRDSRLLLAWHMGKRSDIDTWEFARKLRHAIAGRFQLSTDGYTPYRTAIPGTFGDRVDFAQITKVYGNSPDEHRYSPGTVIDVKVHIRWGNPNASKISTSYCERSNLTIRMCLRRWTRLTNAFSKSLRHHEAAFALFVAYYNFIRVHETLKSTPAVAAGLADKTWSIGDLLEQTATHS